jgi:hypothetical protein
MRTGWAVIPLWLISFGALAQGFPVKNADTAMSIAKHVCQGKADPSLEWQADLDAAGKLWSASTMRSIKKSSDPLWVVDIPVNGPLPTNCAQSLYELLPARPHP